MLQTLLLQGALHGGHQLHPQSHALGDSRNILTALPAMQYYGVTMICLFVGTMGFPALIIFPVFLWRRKIAQRAVANGALSAPGMLPRFRGQVLAAQYCT